MEFPGFENSRQWPQKAKVMTKICKTKRASEDMLVPVALQPGPTVPQSLGVIMETNGVSWIGKQLTVQTQRSHKCIKHSERWQIQTFR